MKAGKYVLTRLATAWLPLVFAAGTHAADKVGCHAIALTGEVRAGETYDRVIGGELAVHLVPRRFADPSADPKRQLDGWRIELWPAGQSATAGSTQDFIYPVNPPLRFNPSQDLGTSYGIPAVEKLRRPIEYAFVLSRADFRMISDLEEEALWPPAGAAPSEVDEKFLTALKNARLGKIRLEATRYAASENGMSLRSLTFVIRVIAPKTFTFAKDLTPVPSACPARENWP